MVCATDNTRDEVQGRASRKCGVVAGQLELLRRRAKTKRHEATLLRQMARALSRSADRERLMRQAEQIELEAEQLEREAANIAHLTLPSRTHGESPAADDSDVRKARTLRAEAERYLRLGRGLSLGADQDLLFKHAREMDEAADALERPGLAAGASASRSVVQMQQQTQRQQSTPAVGSKRQKPKP